MTCRPVLIAGPTASGKSELALEIAAATGGVIINADSQQVYAGWRILTARPSDAEMAGIPHHLYGHVDLDQEYSVGHWLRDISPILDHCRDAGLRPIIVGGTGLYFGALTRGLAQIPAVPAEVRAQGERHLTEVGLAEIVRDLSVRDPETAAGIDLDNPRRVLRAWEVLEATGMGLGAWQRRTPPPLLPLGSCHALCLVPLPDWLYRRCNARFERMLEDGALDEVARIRTLGLAPDAPGMHPVGAPELGAYLDGEIPLDDAMTAAMAETRRYAKRQLTWFRNQMAGWEKIALPMSEKEKAALIAKISAAC